MDSEGIGVEFEQRAKAMGATSPEPQSKSEALNADMFKVVADKLVAESGVTPLLHAVVIDAVMEGDALVGVVTHSKAMSQGYVAAGDRAAVRGRIFGD